MTRPPTEPPRVRLRDITLADADLLDAWDGERSAYNDFGLPHDPTDREALARGPLRTERNGQLIVELVRRRTADRHGRLASRDVRPEPRVVGVQLRHRADPGGARPGLRDRSPGAARRLPLRHHRRAPRRGRRPTSSNIAEQRSLEKAGLRREGVTRGAQFRAGAYHDLVVFAMLRDDRDGLTGKLARPAATVRAAWIASTGSPSTRPRTSSPTSPAST